MKSKQAPRASAKQTPSVSKKKDHTTNKVIAMSTASPSTSDLDEVASLFNTIKQTKAQKYGSAAAAQPPSLQRGAGGASVEAHNIKRSSTGAGAPPPSSSPGAQAKPVHDGLYHAPEKSVQMSDNQFFSGTWLREDRTVAPTATTSSAVPSTASPEASEKLLRREGVHRIVSIQELSKMLSHNARAGTTPNCPFDCDCCF
ncbi:Eukaryotic protein of unknown function (DUF1764) putative [Leishmania donovani]|uniref:Eukaryotic_protein_of_uncharacterized_function_(D UF1764)_-_putative n=2 Tax=Leishmania donovani species complex TaxID=38574 RepID=A0A6L0XRT9_LEIIN|nr:hypothetical protein CGC20_15510 [Leishmania donovani]CAC9544856.1 Eukaryotic_protein_of_uncharacterised_function_(DUF1764)_-_putative [Leishmania infantum]CAJ1993049.1 Eukaryotic protein of unknown function (DUF1764) putative [Leishmania donovani]SUZ46066.1 Eukaryotic_protein_of_uncharacterised_function_(DUF1764)_-_putative [Leishmania infantum]